MTKLTNTIPTSLDPKEAIERLKDILKCQENEKSSWDEEGQHRVAEKILCAMLSNLGYPEITEIWEKLTQEWWYC